MNQAQFDAIVTRSKDLWEGMETYRLAYATESESDNKKSEQLKWFTLLCGLITAIGAVPNIMEIDFLKYLSGIFGALTGTLTLVEKHFRWDESSANKWKMHKALEDLQKEIFYFCLEAGPDTDYDEASLFVEQIRSKQSKKTSLRIDGLNSWKAKASDALATHGFNQITFAPAAPPEEVFEEDDFIADEVEGMVALVRGGA